ncbi:MAG: hypothetical protein RBG13Loki_2199 [Promethearchaeota archaeon CR_4]|nr:MAG: hypothetical protein RBG13Loki_2199 [Candidatus Lokiarchaeota archaeon CR_4]
MVILISKKVHEFLKNRGLGGKTMVIDGSFYENSAKPCGCCGPPPSLDYKVQFFAERQLPAPLHDATKFTHIQNKMQVVIDRLLFSAVEAAKQRVIVMAEEDTRGGYRIYAKIM